MNIAFVCNEYPPAVGGGIGTAVRALARGLAAAGHGVVVVGLYPQASVEDDGGVRVHRIAFPMHRLVQRQWLARRHLHAQLKRLCARHAIEVVEWPDFQGLFHAPIPGVTDVLKLHGTTWSHRLHGFIRPRWLSQLGWEWHERRTMRALRCWVGVSDWFLQEWTQRLAIEPAVQAVVHNPVDQAIFHPPRSGVPREPVVLYCGAFRERKGVRTLVRAAHEAMRAGVPFRLRMVGYEAELSRADLLGLAPGNEDRIEFVPFSAQQQVAEEMRRCRVFAMPSHYESCGNGWLEAAMCGTPSIGSTAACGPEVVRHGVDGVLVDPGDVAATASAIADLLTDDARWQALSDACLRDAPGRFGLRAGVQHSLDFYAAAVRAGRDGR